MPQPDKRSALQILARLLNLNQQRATEERLAGAANTPAKSAAKPAKTAAKRASKKSAPSAQSSLLPPDDD